MKEIGLALGGGGSKGLCHIAFIKALDDMGVKPALIAGTSIGAVIGGFYAAGISGLEIAEELKNIRLRDLYQMAVDFSLFSNSALYRGKGVEDYLSRQIPVRTFEELTIPLKVVATDFWNRREVVLEKGDLSTAIRASMAMPAIFEPVLLAGTVLIDGGAVNPLPYDLLQGRCEISIAIDVSGEKTYSPNDPVPNILENILSTFQIMQASIVDAKRKIFPPDFYIKPALTNIRVLDFYRYKEILGGVQDEVARFKQDLEKALK